MLDKPTEGGNRKWLAETVVHAVLFQFLLLLLRRQSPHHNNWHLTDMRIRIPADIFQDLPAAFERQQQVYGH